MGSLDKGSLSVYAQGLCYVCRRLDNISVSFQFQIGKGC